MCNVCHWHPDPDALNTALRAIERNLSALSRRFAALEKQGDTFTFGFSTPRKRRRDAITAGVRRHFSSLSPKGDSPQPYGR